MGSNVVVFGALNPNAEGAAELAFKRRDAATLQEYIEKIKAVEKDFYIRAKTLFETQKTMHRAAQEGTVTAITNAEPHCVQQARDLMIAALWLISIIKQDALKMFKQDPELQAQLQDALNKTKNNMNLVTQAFPAHAVFKELIQCDNTVTDKKSLGNEIDTFTEKRLQSIFDRQ